MDDALVPETMGKPAKMAVQFSLFCAAVFILITVILTFTAGSDNAAWVVIGIAITALFGMLGVMLKWMRDGNYDPDHLKYVAAGQTVALVILACSCLAVIYADPPIAKYTIGGTIDGVTGGGLVLQNNGKGDLSVNGGGCSPFTFKDKMSAGGSYHVTVKAQPSSSTCTVQGGSGHANGPVTSPSVICTPSWTIGGNVGGLKGTGLVLQNNGADSLQVQSDGPFQFKTLVPDKGAYAVTVSSQPSTGSCQASFNTGTATAAVTNVVITCQ